MHDVVVVGAGPAGATLSRLLAAEGADVLLVERDRLPRYKPCGGGLTRRALRLLPAEARGVARVRCVEADVVFGRHRLRVTAGDTAVTMVMRDAFDHQLVRLAAAAGARVRDGAAVSAARLMADGVELIAGGEPVRARYVACADGAAGPFAGRFGEAVGLAPTGARRIPALEAEVEDPGGAWGDRLRGDFDVVPGGYGWVFPKGGILSVGLASWRAGVGGRLLRERLDGYLRRLGLQDRRLLRRHGHPIPVGGWTPCSALAGERAIRLGDAGGLADPLFGEGIAHALHSAHLAARPLLAGAPREYALAVAARMQRTFRGAAALGGLFYPAPAPWVLLARSWPRLADRLFTLAVGGDADAASL